MSYDLRADVKSMLNSTSLTDPGEIADKVAENVPSRSLRDALRVTLRAFVRQVMSEARTNNNPQFSGGGHRCYDTHHEHAAAGTTSTRSWKRSGIRDGWQRQLDARFHVGDHQWKQLRDMTYADLLTAADEREATARRNQAWARTLHSWAALLTEHNVDTFGELPVAVQMGALS